MFRKGEVAVTPHDFMAKTFIIDTNVLIDDPEAIFRMEDNNVLLPDVVLEELDHFKTEHSDRGESVRKVTRHIDNLCQKGSIIKGIPLGKGMGQIRIGFTPINGSDSRQHNFPLSLDNNDNRILYLGKSEHEAIIISKDMNLRVRANLLGIRAEDYRNDHVESGKGIYMGRTKAYVDTSLLEYFKEKKTLEKDIIMSSFYMADGKQFNEELVVNEFFELYPIGQKNPSAILGRYDGNKIVPLRYTSAAMYGVQPRNIGQHFMKEALMTPADEAPLVILKGTAGTAKTYFALAAGLQKYSESRKGHEVYNRILICRPSVTMDEDIGTLPGTEKEKISPYMRAAKDNVFALRHGIGAMSPNEYKQAEEEIEMMFSDDYIKTEALAYLRGRTLNHYWFILDEMQNSSPSQAKGVVTRMGENSKVILLGDPEQIDNPRNSPRSNGLVYASERMKGSPLCWQVSLFYEESEKSALALEAAKRM